MPSSAVASLATTGWLLEWSSCMEFAIYVWCGRGEAGAHQWHTWSLHKYTQEVLWALRTHMEGTIILIPKWNYNISLCVSPVFQQICVPCRNSLSPLISTALPTYTFPPWPAHFLCPRPPFPSYNHLPFPSLPPHPWSSWIEAPAMQTASVKTQAPMHALSQVASTKPIWVSASSSLEWGWC